MFGIFTTSLVPFTGFVISFTTTCHVAIFVVVLAGTTLFIVLLSAGGLFSTSRGIA
ncbi:MAG: hypothetical protein WCG25_04240 [bacterium]